MSRQAQDTNVRVQIVVEAPIERAFTVFTKDIGTWMPSEYNMLAVPIAERIFEPRAGGRVYDRGVDGSECHWANVLAYEPPDRVVIAWRINPRWQIEADPAKTSEVEVRFFPESHDRTRVELEHRHLERHGEGWERERDQLASEGGWPGCLRLFARRIASSH